MCVCVCVCCVCVCVCVNQGLRDVEMLITNVTQYFTFEFSSCFQANLLETNDIIKVMLF